MAVADKKKKYLDNKDFEDLLIKYQKTKDPDTLKRLCEIFENIAKKVYYMAVNNMYSRVGNLFPKPNSYDREDMIQNAVMFGITAIPYWDKKRKNKKGVKTTAFNYFSSIIIYETQNIMKKEFRKAWHKSPLLTKQFTLKMIQDRGIKMPQKLVEEKDERYEN